jgi:hypothetical protein
LRCPLATTLLSALFRDKMSTSPVAILVLDNNQYVAISTYNPTTDVSDFIVQLYNHIRYDVTTNSNLTNIGPLREIHTRMIDTPITERGDTVWFSTYQHPLTQYRPVHRPSPVTFSQAIASSWRAQQPMLHHESCQHIIIPNVNHTDSASPNN